MPDRSYVERLRTSGGPSHDLLVLLDQHRVMTTDQLARATETPDRTVRHRLERLRGAGLVDAVRPGREAGSAPRHWWLRPAGARLIAGTAAGEGRKPSPMFVAHAAAITETWLALREHGPAAGLRLVDWWADRAGWQEWETRSPGYGTRLRRLTPDAIALVDLTTTTTTTADVVGQAAAFVEVDLASMTQVLLREKVTRYLAYAADGAWEGIWLHCPPLLLLTTTASRAATFIAAAGKLMASARSQTGRLGGQRGRDIAAAQSLVVAACGLVRDPAAAVTGTVWMLPAEAAALVSLPELLAERIAAQARAQHWYDQADVERHRQQRADRLGLVDVDDVDRLLGAPAAAFLGYAIDRQPRVLADADPELVDAVLRWWDGDRTDPAAAGRLREVLVDRHHQEWTRQARTLLAAVNQLGDQPRLCAAAARIQRGELLTRTEVELLELPPGRSREQIQQTALAGYESDRDAAAAAAYAALPWRARRRTSVDELAAARDVDRLLVCGTCRLLSVRPGPDDWRPETCDHCAGPLLPYADRDQLPTPHRPVRRHPRPARHLTGRAATSGNSSSSPPPTAPGKPHPSAPWRCSGSSPPPTASGTPPPTSSGWPYRPCPSTTSRPTRCPCHRSTSRRRPHPCHHSSP